MSQIINQGKQFKSVEN